MELRSSRGVWRGLFFYIYTAARVAGLSRELLVIRLWITSHKNMSHEEMDLSEAGLQLNRERMSRGELYYAFTPDLIAARARCVRACRRFNAAEDVSRRRLVELWKE